MLHPNRKTIDLISFEKELPSRSPFGQGPFQQSANVFFGEDESNHVDL